MINKETRRERVAEMLLEELKTGMEEWYYISTVHVPTNKFRCGFLIQAKGPTMAWVLGHALNLFEEDVESRTYGPIPEDVLPNISEGMRWRKLSKEEAINLGK